MKGLILKVSHKVLALGQQETGAISYVIKLADCIS